MEEEPNFAVVWRPTDDPSLPGACRLPTSSSFLATKYHNYEPQPIAYTSRTLSRSHYRPPHLSSHRQPDVVLSRKLSKQTLRLANTTRCRTPSHAKDDMRRDSAGPNSTEKSIYKDCESAPYTGNTSASTHAHSSQQRPVGVGLSKGSHAGAPIFSSSTVVICDPVLLEVDSGPSDHNDDVEPDEGYCEGSEIQPLMDGPAALAAGITGAMRHGTGLRWRSASESALRCPRVVRNTPRMRRRKARSSTLPSDNTNLTVSSPRLIRSPPQST